MRQKLVLVGLLVLSFFVAASVSFAENEAKWQKLHDRTDQLSQDTDRLLKEVDAVNQEFDTFARRPISSVGLSEAFKMLAEESNVLVRLGELLLKLERKRLEWKEVDTEVANLCKQEVAAVQCGWKTLHD
ncbi:MAG: hypothetical protein HY006_01665 [Candidatus Sungbacteria bacterium]|nr:hypothetical protein [Candidatus Sungbacteria bacterium]